MSCARLTCGANWQNAPTMNVASNVFVFIVLNFSLLCRLT
jgi:hypothetical protein